MSMEMDLSSLTVRSRLKRDGGDSCLLAAPRAITGSRGLAPDFGVKLYLSLFCWRILMIGAPGEPARRIARVRGSEMLEPATAATMALNMGDGSFASDLVS